MVNYCQVVEIIIEFWQIINISHSESFIGSTVNWNHDWIQPQYHRRS